MISCHFRAGRIFYGSKIDQPISAKAKIHLDTFPKTFASPSSNEYFKIYRKNQICGNFTKTALFRQVLFLLLLLRFEVPRCCFLKSMISQLSFAQKDLQKSFTTSKVMLI